MEHRRLLLGCRRRLRLRRSEVQASVVGIHDSRGRGHAAHRHLLALVGPVDEHDGERLLVVEVVLGRSLHVVVVVATEGDRRELGLGIRIVGQRRERLLVTLEVRSLAGSNHTPEVRLGALAIGFRKADLFKH